MKKNGPDAILRYTVHFLYTKSVKEFAHAKVYLSWSQTEMWLCLQLKEVKETALHMRKPGVESFDQWEYESTWGVHDVKDNLFKLKDYVIWWVV